MSHKSLVPWKMQLCLLLLKTFHRECDYTSVLSGKLVSLRDAVTAVRLLVLLSDLTRFSVLPQNSFKHLVESHTTFSFTQRHKTEQQQYIFWWLYIKINSPDQVPQDDGTVSLICDAAPLLLSCSSVCDKTEAPPPSCCCCLGKQSR